VTSAPATTTIPWSDECAGDDGDDNDDTEDEDSDD
jgi:hypothetical protein